MSKRTIVTVTQRAELRRMGGGRKTFAEGTRYNVELTEAEALVADGSAVVEDATPDEEKALTDHGLAVVRTTDFARELADEKTATRDRELAAARAGQ